MKTTKANRNELTKAQTREMLDKALTTKWHTFVCECVALMTAKSPREGYSVRAAGDLWEICHMGLAQFAPMTASTAYSWFVRTPGLATLMRTADDLRTTAHQIAGNI